MGGELPHSMDKAYHMLNTGFIVVFITNRLRREINGCEN
jgi:hypothetical protein